LSVQVIRALRKGKRGEREERKGREEDKDIVEVEVAIHMGRHGLVVQDLSCLARPTKVPTPPVTSHSIVNRLSEQLKVCTTPLLSPAYSTLMSSLNSLHIHSISRLLSAWASDRPPGR
jgi:inhibitor of KinA sporulation pathway (predicted exonuclease)